MENFLVFITIFLGTVVTIILSWSILYFNGKTLAYLIPSKAINNRNNSEAKIFLLGLAPFALASLIGTSFNTCTNSFLLLTIVEAIILIVLGIVALYNKRIPNFFLKETFDKNKPALILALLWCLVFSLWATLALDPLVPQQLDRVLVNTNPDMWSYLRRFAAFTGENITFDGESACSYLLISPKKLSSFIGSIIIHLVPDPGLGIIFLKGLFGCSLFLGIFAHWSDFSKNKLGILWAVTSPQVYWLILSSYLSNTLFIIVLCLGLRFARSISLAGRIGEMEFKVILWGFMLCVYSFYPAGLPLSVILFLATALIYSFDLQQQQQSIKRQMGILGATALGFILLYLFFREQLFLDEVQGLLNPFFKHGKDFVPLNPWSLVQEKPKPMGDEKDFGVWINITIGLIFSLLVGRKIWQALTRTENSPAQRDLVAGLAGILFYSGYLMAHIPLEHTYRLAKIAISSLWPLALFGLFPLINWLRYQVLYNRPKSVRWLVTAFVGLHIVLHIDETFDLHASYSGKHTVNTQSVTPDSSSITLIRCPDLDEGIKYEVMAGFRLTRQYPQLPIHVITNVAEKSETPAKSKVIQGVAVRVNREVEVCGYR